MIGVTVVLITCSYNDAEFVRVGYYVNNEYDCEELRETPPEVPIPERIIRTILGDKPRVTRFPIKWDEILDETVKKAEDEEIDKDADVNAFGATGPGMMDDDHQGNMDEDEDSDDEMMDDSAEEEGEEEDDDFTSQLGPDEQDRMGMMIDDEADGTENVSLNFPTSNAMSSKPFTPSTLSGEPIINTFTQ
jgi:histone chaperone ASF1